MRHISEFAEQFIREHADLCDAVVHHAKSFVAHYNYALAERDTLIRCLLALRDELRKFAQQHVVDEKRLLLSVMQRLRFKRVFDYTTARLLAEVKRRVYLLKRLYKEHCDFETTILHEKLMRELRLHVTVDDAALLRDKVRAIMIHYASLTSVHDAVNFLRDLATKFEQLL